MNNVRFESDVELISMLSEFVAALATNSESKLWCASTETEDMKSHPC